VSASTRPRIGPLRVSLVVLLVVAAFFAVLPWLGCLGTHPRGDQFFMARVCTVGYPSPIMGDRGLGQGLGPLTLPPGPIDLPGFSGPYWGNLIVGVLYLLAARYTAFTKRPL
jgi:hypothetical protein